MKQTLMTYHSAVKDSDSDSEPPDLPYKPPVPGLPSTPPVQPAQEPPLQPADDLPVTGPAPWTPIPSPVTI